MQDMSVFFSLSTCTHRESEKDGINSTDDSLKIYQFHSSSCLILLEQAFCETGIPHIRQAAREPCNAKHVSIEVWTGEAQHVLQDAWKLTCSNGPSTRNLPVKCLVLIPNGLCMPHL